MSSELSGGFASVSAEETAGGTVACRTRMLEFALVFVLVRIVFVRTAVMADSSVGGTVAFCNVVS